MTAKQHTDGSRVDQAYAVLKEKIINNHFPPGFQALERELCTLLQMSRTPVREALIRLSKEGLIELIPRRGMRVVPLSSEAMLEIYDVIACLEDKALELILKQKLPVTRFANLEKYLEEMENALEADDLDTWAKWDELFHAELFNLCGNQTLASLAESLKTKTHRARMITLRMRPKPVQSNTDHRQLVTCLKQRQGKEARQIHRQHRERASTLITERLDVLKWV